MGKKFYLLYSLIYFADDTAESLGLKQYRTDENRLKFRFLLICGVVLINKKANAIAGTEETSCIRS